MAVPLTAREPVEFTPPSAPEALREIDPATDRPKFAIFVRVPTAVERDTYHAALVRADVKTYSKRQIRELGLAGIQELYPPEEHDELVEIMRESWSDEDAHAEMADEQRKRLIELLEEAKSKGGNEAVPDPKLVREEMDKIRPSVVMDSRRKIRAISLGQEIASRFEPLREAIASLIEMDAKRAWYNAEIYVTGWRGLEHTPDGNGRGGITRHEATYLRQQIGHEAWLELSDFITAMQGIDEDEEKNLDLLLESMSAPTGSIQPTTGSGSSDGSSTDEHSSEIPESTGSRTTTAKSSGSSSRAKTRKAGASKSGRTAGR